MQAAGARRSRSATLRSDSECKAEDSSHYKAMSKFIDGQRAIPQRGSQALLLTHKRVRRPNSRRPTPPAV